MGRQKNDGLGRFGGRQKGTPNKATADVKTWVANILNGGRADFERRLANLEDREFVRTFVGLLGYILPKQQPTSPEGEDGQHIHKRHSRAAIPISIHDRSGTAATKRR